MSAARRTVPFRLPFNVGTDIVYIPRIKNIITKPAKSTDSRWGSTGDRFLRRIMHRKETQHFYSKFGCSDSQLPSHFTTTPSESLSLKDTMTLYQMGRWIGGRFAAKEAARKAAPGGAASLSFRDVIVQTEGEGGCVAAHRPEVIYLQSGAGGRQTGKLSISHDGDYVVASVLAAAPASAFRQGGMGAGVGSGPRQYKVRRVPGGTTPVGAGPQEGPLRRVVSWRFS